jgi:MFS family permease
MYMSLAAISHNRIVWTKILMKSPKGNVLISLPFSPLISDGYGRRVCIFVGCVIILIGTAVQTTAYTIGHFIAGRLILGLGAAVAQATGPVYAVELAHPAYRGLLRACTITFGGLGISGLRGSPTAAACECSPPVTVSYSSLYTWRVC